MSYSDLSREITENYIHSAVIIDDEFEWGASDPVDQEDKNVDDFDQGMDEFDQDTDDENRPAEPVKSKIDAVNIVKSFCGKGIVCAPYFFDKSDDSIRLPSSVHQADLLIIDWKLRDDEVLGQTATSLIRKLLSEDIKGEPKLRFITVYSAEKQQDIIDGLVRAFADSDNLRAEEHSNHVDVSYKNRKICRIHYLKKGSDGCEEADLAGRVTELFTQFVSGYFPNAVLAAVSEIRQKTPQYLAEFSSDLDIPLLSHFTSLQAQKDNFATSSVLFKEYVAELIGGRIVTDLETSDHITKLTHVKMQVDYLSQQDDTALVYPKNNRVADSDWKDLLQANSWNEYLGILRSRKEKKVFNKNVFDGIKNGRGSANLQVGPDGNLENFYRLSEIDLFENTRNTSFERQNSMTVGCLVKQHSGWDGYYLCIQPLCDSVRLKQNESHSFPFLAVDVVTDDGKFDLVFKYREDYVKLRVLCKPSKIVSFSFKADPENQDVRFETDHSIEDANGDKFDWVGQLKPVYAQEVLNNLASHGSRVGSNKFEWLRQKSMK